ncbi:MAG: 5-(carboxyamino)imidazole ribonucleotide synthase [Melioribacteraceae bacterium]|nr:5-(carboxyamino)imidazole ribonucleotide synthase [Melioribacteraceae bacterium]
MTEKVTIGILGGGQLARMSALQAYKLGYEIAILEKTINSPAGQLTHKEFVGWVDDYKLLKKFSLSSSIITLENEFVDYHQLEFLEQLGKKVIPSSKTISLIQDKFIQKETLKKNKIPVAKFIKININSEYDDYTKILGKKFVIKSRKLGYDGYGNFIVKSESSFKEGIEKLSKRHSELYAEEFIDFKKELAIIVVRNSKEIKTYPVVETIQKNNICHLVIAPAILNNELIKKVKSIAIKCVKAVNGFGVFGIEFFLTKENKILVNEMAPRTHNTGHYTIEACVTSQFENHIRSILDLPLGSTEMVDKSAVMINLLGKTNGLNFPKNIEDALKNKNAHVHIYGKEESRKGRKLGHITLVGKNKNELLKQAKSLEKKIIY